MDTKLLRQKILDLAIRGKLVPQDPNDEPASVLLEKTRAEKERLIKEKKIKPTKGKSDKSHYKKEVPFEVPESWEWVKISDISFLKAGSFIKAKDIKSEKSNNLYPCYGGNGLRGYVETFNYEGIYSLIGRQGALCGNINLVEGKFYATEHAVTTTLFGCIDPYWIYFTLKALNLNQYATGAAQPGLSVERINNVYCPLPPLNEQKRISSKINSLFVLIDRIDENQLSLEQFVNQTKSKVLELAIKGKLVPQNPEDEPASTLLERLGKNDKIKKASDKSHYQFEVPEGWVTCQLYKICDFERGVTFPSSAKQTLKRENTIACVRTANVQEQLELDDLWYIDKSFLKNNRKKLLRKSDIVISSANSKELVGKTSFVENINEEMCFGGFVMVIRTNFINNKFLFYYLRDCFYNGIFSKNASQTTNIANINTTILGNLVIKVPPLAEQQRIVNKIEEIFKILDIIQENLQTNV